MRLGVGSGARQLRLSSYFGRKVDGSSCRRPKFATRISTEGRGIFSLGLQEGGGGERGVNFRPESTILVEEVDVSGIKDRFYIQLEIQEKA